MNGNVTPLGLVLYSRNANSVIVFDPTEQPAFRDVLKDIREQVDGSEIIQIIDFVDEYDIDMITFRSHISKDTPHRLRIYEDRNSDPTTEIPLENTPYAATPLRVAENVAEDKVSMIEAKGDETSIPRIADSALKVIGHTILPETDELEKP